MAEYGTKRMIINQANTTAESNGRFFNKTNRESECSIMNRFIVFIWTLQRCIWLWHDWVVRPSVCRLLSVRLSSVYRL